MAKVHKEFQKIAKRNFERYRSTLDALDRTNTKHVRVLTRKRLD